MDQSTKMAMAEIRNQLHLKIKKIHEKEQEDAERSKVNLIYQI